MLTLLWHQNVYKTEKLRFAQKFNAEHARDYMLTLITNIEDQMLVQPGDSRNILN